MKETREEVAAKWLMKAHESLHLCPSGLSTLIGLMLRELDACKPKRKEKQ